MIGVLGRKGTGKTTLQKYILLAHAQKNPKVPVVVVDPMGNFRAYKSDVLVPQKSYDLANQGRVVDGAQALLEYAIIYKAPAVVAIDDVANVQCISANLQAARGKNPLLVSLSTGNRHLGIHLAWTAQTRTGLPRAWMQNSDILYIFPMDDADAVKEITKYKRIPNLPDVLDKLPQFHCVKISANVGGGNQYQIINTKPFMDFVIRAEQNPNALPDFGTTKWRLDTAQTARK